MAVKKSDPRDPDTAADSAPADSNPAAMDPEMYGFSTIEPSEPAEGPGVVEPTRVEPLSSVPNSTFASRAGKAVQSAENK